ncbi:hypothetical protein B0H12DRAFT_542459 [Mycena haematopus]|nr:hypothetical protein B0H12DRAFT_542459 [Mycena haematopus]
MQTSAQKNRLGWFALIYSRFKLKVIHSSFQGEGFSTSTSKSNASATTAQSTSNHTTPSSAAPIQTGHRNNVRAKAIAASIVTVIFIVGVMFSLFWLRRRRQGIRDRRRPKQFIESREHTQPEPSMIKVVALAGVELAEAEVDQSTLVAAAVSDEAQLKHGAPERPRADSGNVRVTAVAVVAPEETEAALRDRQQFTRDEETMTLRLRRVEAQLEALLTQGLSEGSPPSYWG